MRGEELESMSDLMDRKRQLYAALRTLSLIHI